MIIVLLGAPGVGKGTAASLLAKRHKLPHVSTGDIFKKAIREQTPVGKKVKAIVESGKLVPDNLVNEIMQERLREPDLKKGLFLDGYPRTLAQGEALQKFAKPSLVLNFSAGRDEIISRLSGRRVCPNCGAIYHIKTTPPKKKDVCNECSNKLILRKDDAPSVIGKRLDVYDRQTKPLIDYYAKKGLIAAIDANYGMDEIEKILKQCDDAIQRVNK